MQKNRAVDCRLGLGGVWRCKRTPAFGAHGCAGHWIQECWGTWPLVLAGKPTARRGGIPGVPRAASGIWLSGGRPLVRRRGPNHRRYRRRHRARRHLGRRRNQRQVGAPSWMRATTAPI